MELEQKLVALLSKIEAAAEQLGPGVYEASLRAIFLEGAISAIAAVAVIIVSGSLAAFCFLRLTAGVDEDREIGYVIVLAPSGLAFIAGAFVLAVSVSRWMMAVLDPQAALIHRFLL